MRAFVLIALAAFLSLAGWRSFGSNAGEAAAQSPLAPKPPDIPANGHKFAVIMGGTYKVGQAGHETNPAREVELGGYLIALHETTNAQFARFVDSTGHVTDAERSGWAYTFQEGLRDWEWTRCDGAYWRRPFGPDGPKAEDLPDHPVTQISHGDAMAYCAWIDARLPTPEEWEVAARAGAETLHPWGDELMPDGKAMANTWQGKSHAKNDMLDGHLYTSPVGSFPTNAWGLSDVIGNVFEYCSGDPRAYFPGAPRGLAMGRGGSWWCSPGTCDFHNLVDIGKMVDYGSLCNQGFRVAYNPPAPAKPPRLRNTDGPGS